MGLDGAQAGGLIPARAGKTPACAGKTSAEWAHPRVCGENGRWAPKAKAWTGSSPRVRGKPSESSAERIRAGLIPARAGKTAPP